MTQVVDIRNADDPRDVIHRSVQLLADGAIIALPTESGYVLAAHLLNAQAVQRLVSLDSAAEPFSRQLALKSAQEVRDYVLNLSRLGSKLTRRYWPGPVAIVFRVEQKQGLLEAISSETRSVVIDGGRCGFRVPADDVFREVLRLSQAPLILATEHHSKSQSAIARTASDITDLYSDEVTLVVDNGPSRYDQPAPIVEVENERWKCIKPGVVNETTLGRLASEVYLFVCTGNTCRSPMAEGWFRKLLSQRLKCSEDDLVDHGYLVSSAGLAAALGARASLDAVTVTAEHDVDLHGHESRPLTDHMLSQADHIYTMTRGHRDSILSLRPDLADTVSVLSPDGSDVPDPIGFGLGEYKNCEKKIKQSVREIVDRLPSP